MSMNPSTVAMFLKPFVPFNLPELFCEDFSLQTGNKRNNGLFLNKRKKKGEKKKKKDAALGSLPLQAPTTFLSKAPAVTHQPQPAKDSNNDSLLFSTV